MSSTTYVKPDSVLARTAREVLEAHAGGAGPRDGMIACPVCGQPLPCSTGRAAAEVLFAAGLAQSSGLVEASRGGLGPAVGQSPFGAPVVPAPVPAAAPAPVPAAAPAPVPAAAPPPVPAAAPPPVAEAPAVASAPPDWGIGHEPAPSGLTDGRTEAVPDTAAASPNGWSTPVDSGAPAVTAPEVTPPAAEPEPAEEIDPLLLGPPIYDRQNRPLDAPQFTPSSRPPVAVEPIPASGPWPAAGGPSTVTPHAAEQPSAPAQPAEWETGPSTWPGAGPVGGIHPGPIDSSPAGAVQTGGGLATGARPPVEPQPGRPNGPAATPAPLDDGQAGPGLQPSPSVGHQTTTASLGRPARPPLEPPQMGQLNRPLQAPSAPATAAAEATPSGLPGTAGEAPSGLPGMAGAPSGLPVVSDADQSPGPSGLWGVTRSPGRASGLADVPSPPATAPTAESDITELTLSGLPFRPETESPS